MYVFFSPFMLYKYARKTFYLRLRSVSFVIRVTRFPLNHTSADYVRSSICVHISVCVSVMHIYIIFFILNIIMIIKILIVWFFE